MTTKNWLLLIVPVCVFGWCIWNIVVVSAYRGAYYPHSPIFENFQYPLASVIASVSLLIAEALLTAKILHRKRDRRVWPRALVLTVCMFPISRCAFLGTMHAPPYVFYHEVWLLFLNLFVLLVTLCSVAIQLAATIRSNRN